MQQLIRNGDINPKVLPSWVACLTQMRIYLIAAQQGSQCSSAHQLQIPSQGGCHGDEIDINDNEYTTNYRMFWAADELNF